jgi:RND family efflux transporter MFP subunit
MIRNITFLIFTASVAVVTLGCGNQQSAKTEASSSVGQNSVIGPKVQVVKPEVRSVSAFVQTTGSFVARESSDVAPPAAGRIAETPVDVGDFIQTGRVIARLDDREARLKLDQAEATEQQQKAAYDAALTEAKLSTAEAQRYENLIKTGDVSEYAYEKAIADSETAAAQVSSAQQQLLGAKAQDALAQKAIEDTMIRAPFSGFVSSRPIAVGQYVALTSKVATVLHITPIHLELQVQQANAQQIRIGADVNATVNGFGERVFRGKVVAINPAIDPNSRAFAVIVEFANSDLSLKPGMFAAAQILLAGNSQALYVPRQAVLTDATTSSSQLFFVRDGKARLAVVQLGAADRDAVQILSGISGESKIAINSLQDLYDGESVQIAETGR